MLWTTLAFALLTVVLVFVHARRRSSAAPAAAASGCPRCGARIPASAAACPSCGAPRQAFELVTARRVEAAPQREGPLHALVRADTCVGCGTCVDVCPEPGAIRLVNKLATVDLDRCKGHGSCAAACPVGAIVVSQGDAVQHVEVPDLDANFQSNVPGLYVVGELGGRGLIKNAINEGKIAIEHVARMSASEARRGVRNPDEFDVVIAGSGPAGLSAALEARRQGLRYLVLEQGTLSDTIRKYPRKKLLFAEPVRMPIYGDLWVADGSKESLLQVWQTMIESAGLVIRTHQRVEAIEPAGDGFEVLASGERHRTRRVVLALGRRGTPRRLGVPGEELDKVFYDIVEMEAFAGQKALVVGGGDSAVESALGLAHQPGTTVTLSYRGAEFGRVKDRNREKLDRAVASGSVTLRLGSQVREIRPGTVTIEHEGRSDVLPNDVVIVRIGGEAPYPFLTRLGIRIVRKELAIVEPEGARAAAGA